MPRALLDTSVLFAAAYRRDAAHDEAVAILRGIDSGDLPDGVVVEYVLAETLNGLTTHAGHDPAVDFLDRLEENANFHIESITGQVHASAKSIFRRHPRLSFVDAAVVAHMRTGGLGYLYAFDDDFDGIDDVYRLDSLTNPYRPE
ncbi:PIN domain-containing protein [Halobaculum sp. CBA1158]|uniref:type II toxin-antitoxin system VapC family toxin n=1 Tax=Halobaculum sp. CBA1158 TaxID=2904243 RepID=UPI001F1A47E8|nr:PIN domain-containing protein [Halobaculum sp. CBA1158]UIP00392.1 PIN domain-containing protein [Halobaculum sp. CBA1158]